MTGKKRARKEGSAAGAGGGAGAAGATGAAAKRAASTEAKRARASASAAASDESDGEHFEEQCAGGSGSTASTSSNASSSSTSSSASFSQEEDGADNSSSSSGGGGNGNGNAKRWRPPAKGPYTPRLDLLREGDPGTLSGPPIRLYADGIFDLFHFGHAKALEQAKKLYPHTHLLVGCCSDAVTHKYKGITVMSEDERYESLRHCKWVDEVVEDAPWVVTEDFLRRHHIDYVCHDALPYADTSGQASDGDVYSHLKRHGRFLETQRTEGISTSDIINRVIVHYDDYVLRQLQRGYSAKEMNVPQWKETTLLTKKYLHDVATTTTKTLTEIQHSFIDLFNRNSDIRCSLRKRRKETWHRVSTLFRTPFLNNTANGEEAGQATAAGARAATAAV